MTTPADTYRRVVGNCPMGCGQTLLLGEGGHITCSLLGCPRPTAVDELLDDGETEHIVEFRNDNFSMQHPLRERLDGALYDCDLHISIAALDGPPVRPGRYCAWWSDDDGWQYAKATS